MQLDTLKPGWTEITAVATANQGNVLYAISRDFQLFSLDVRSLKAAVVHPPIQSGRNGLINQLIVTDDGEVWFARDDSANVVAFSVGTQRTIQVSATPGLTCFTNIGPETYVATNGSVRRASGSDSAYLLSHATLPNGVSQLLPST